MQALVPSLSVILPDIPLQCYVADAIYLFADTVAILISIVSFSGGKYILAYEQPMISLETIDIKMATILQKGLFFGFLIVMLMSVSSQSVA